METLTKKLDLKGKLIAALAVILLCALGIKVITVLKNSGVETSPARTIKGVVTETYYSQINSVGNHTLTRFKTVVRINETELESEKHVTASICNINGLHI
jgi:hypothetical protein